MRRMEQIDADIRTQVGLLETNGTGEQLLCAAKLLAGVKDMLDIFAQPYGLDQAPKLLTEIQKLSEDDVAAALYPSMFQQYGAWGSPESRLAELLRERQSALEEWRREMLRPRTPRDLLAETLAQLDGSTSWGERDVCMFLVSGFPHIDIDGLLEGKPNLQKHLPVERCSSVRDALARCSAERHREDLIGRVAELLIKMHESHY